MISHAQKKSVQIALLIRIQKGLGKSGFLKRGKNECLGYMFREWDWISSLARTRRTNSVLRGERRINRLKVIGNGWVPQVVLIPMERIAHLLIGLESEEL